jgi:hypothetical protein
MARFWAWVKWAKDLHGWYRFIAAIGVLLIAGIGLAVGGTAWLILRSGIPLPLTLMAAYCTVVCAIVGATCLAMAPLAYRAFTQGAPARKRGAVIDFGPFRLQHQYPLGPASRLWVGLNPSANATYESQAWYATLQSAIQQGRLHILPSKAYPDLERKDPTWNTIVTRVELKRYAASIGEDPEFLRDG